MFSRSSCWLMAFALSWFVSDAAWARTFTDKNGRKIDAEMVSKTGDQLRIRRTDGAVFTIGLATLSAEDQAFVAGWTSGGAAAGKSGGAPVATVDERVKPNSMVTLEFPELPVDKNGEPAKCNVRIPENYDPAKPVPLLVWIAGGKGGNMPAGGLPLVTKEDFVIAALPYPSTAGPPADLVMGKMSPIWDYQKPMLAAIQKLVPNIDPKVRIVAGFSNGAHTIGCAIESARAEYTEYFNAFVVIEGGAGTAVAKKKLRDKYVYLAWGNDAAKKGSKGYMQSMLGCAKAAKVELTTSEMDGVGHAFPDEEKAKVKAWITDTVIPGLAKGKK